MDATQNKAIGILAGSLLLLLPAVAEAQAVAPKVDFVTLEFPQPIAVIPNTTPTNLFAVIFECLKTNGFNILKADKRSCTLEAHRTIPPSDYEGYDAVLVWLDRAVDDTATIKVQLLFGRFIKIQGKTQMGHVLLSKEEEERVCQPWKSTLTEGLIKSGG